MSRIQRFHCSNSAPGWGDVSTSPPAKDTFELRPEDTPLVMEETWEIRYKWRYFGAALKMSPMVLDGIEEEVTYTRECYREVVRRWMKQTEPTKPTWQALVTALREVKEDNLAMYIRRTFTLGEPPTQYEPFGLPNLHYIYHEHVF